MLRGDVLYVKWLVKTSHQVYEETVDLASKLPRDIERKRIHFYIKGSNLFVYLVEHQPRPKESTVGGPPMYQGQKVQLIYPDREHD
ncbi:hypothetical protein ASE07_23670 [Noviherbaspirillum sp. Root189]|nr:hypothetical protein ASE07_23670 [Noviherbaspirillum sp. Root189]